VGALGLWAANWWARARGSPPSEGEALSYTITINVYGFTFRIVIYEYSIFIFGFVSAKVHSTHTHSHSLYNYTFEHSVLKLARADAAFCEPPKGGPAVWSGIHALGLNLDRLDAAHVHVEQLPVGPRYARTTAREVAGPTPHLGACLVEGLKGDRVATGDVVAWRWTVRSDGLKTFQVDRR